MISTPTLIQRKLIFTLIFSVFTVLAACASKPDALERPKGVTSSFETRTSDSGLKLFSLRVQGKVKTKSRPGNSDDKSLKRLSNWMDQELEQQLSATKYCIDGFTEIERSIGSGFAIIRGECNDLASNNI